MGRCEEQPRAVPQRSEDCLSTALFAASHDLAERHGMWLREFPIP